MDGETFETTDRLFAWRPADPSAAGWYFLPVKGPVAAEIRFAALGRASRFGSIRVTASIGGTHWKTSLFPDRESGGYLLPVKADIRRRAGLSAGDEVTVRLEV
ncbi:hypothetical protein FHR20_003244 [Sphingomonas leidyi]|uniref:DUF1905 domain-containing protein n=1 Tax=Sphingomonas leidyi TaxID=68569 RepID=A0A7X5V2Q0_9SPHN|nr:DUF1905 domain-containing protein [Sphingomonas leidyi]NIJ66271.1 hypothetical protein [Sphingomonas leidyi]